MLPEKYIKCQALPRLAGWTIELCSLYILWESSSCFTVTQSNTLKADNNPYQREESFLHVVCIFKEQMGGADANEYRTRSILSKQVVSVYCFLYISRRLIGHLDLIKTKFKVLCWPTRISISHLIWLWLQLSSFWLLWP